MSILTEKTIRIVIADDHPLMRAALRDAVGSQIECARTIEAASLAALFEILRTETDIDAVLLDLKMPDSKGFSALVRLRTNHPEVPVVIVSATEDSDTVQRAMLLGASGYIVKSAPVDEVAQALEAVLQGRVVTPQLRQSPTPVHDQTAQHCRKLRTLTPQQFNVLVMIAEGASNKEVARQLQIGEGTVKTHITAILLKLGLQRRTQAAVLAQRSLQLISLAEIDESGDEGELQLR